MTSKQTSKSRCIVVMGLHGSGTSAVAGVLHHLGVVMGKRLAGPHPTNPKGHFEDLDFRDMLYPHVQGTSRLKDMKAFIQDRQDEYELWGLKEPAIGYAIAEFAPFFKEYRVIQCERHKVACARSYNKKWPNMELSDILWRHQRLEKAMRRFVTKAKPKLLKVKFNDLTDDAEGQVRKIAKFVFEGREGPDEAQVSAAIEFVEPSFNHRREVEGGTQG